jgi:hypothetical protein
VRRSDTPPVAIWVATLGVLLVATAGAALDADAGSGSVLRHEAQGKIAFETLTSISGEKQGPWEG